MNPIDNWKNFNQELDKYITDTPLSIYIHWPFCLSKCPYCDFNSHLARSVNHDLWLDYYIKELSSFYNYLHNRPIKSIYFGGGTPSLMEPKIVERILDYLNKNTRFDQNIEITLEANPTSAEYNKFLSFKNAGINRVSIGIQSLIAEDLKFLGREHSVDDGLKAIKMASEIFDRYSFDLIYARPKQTIEDWDKELNLALDLASDHISLYQLTIEKGTKFYQMYQKKEFKMPEDELSNDLYFLTDDILSKKGFYNYEISNYAKNNQYSKHNVCYWQYDDYLGIGPGAHSRLRRDRDSFYAFNMIYQPNQWMQNVDSFGVGLQKMDLLNKNDVISELILTGLRLKDGICQKNSLKKIGDRIENFIRKEKLDFLLSENLIIYNNDYFKSSDKGFRILNYVISELIDGIM